MTTTTMNKLDAAQLENVTGGTYEEYCEMSDLINSLHLGFEVKSNSGLMRWLDKYSGLRLRRQCTSYKNYHYFELEDGTTLGHESMMEHLKKYYNITED